LAYSGYWNAESRNRRVAEDAKGAEKNGTANAKSPRRQAAKNGQRERVSK
jgi:hypothetical protein